MFSVSDKNITNFREIINGNDQFVYHTYINNNGKDQWGLICSSMNWITVAIRYLESFPQLDANPDIKGMQIYSIISSIDIVIEAVMQLYRVFFEKKINKLPLKSNSTIFKKYVFTNMDDDDYFKQIRACFGAHPVNLEGINKNKKENRLFASWPYQGLCDNGIDLQVQLYSNDPDTPDATFGLSIKELMEYLESRYNYLNVISDKIISNYEKKKLELAKIKIPIGKTIPEVIKILQAENAIRFNKDEYNGVLYELYLLFKINLYEPEYKDDENTFKNTLHPLIHEIQNNLQTMNLSPLQYEYLLNPKSTLEQELIYELPKLYTSIFHNRRNHDPLFNFYLEQINQLSQNSYPLKEVDSDGQLLLKLKLIFASHPLDN